MIISAFFIKKMKMRAILIKTLQELRDKHYKKISRPQSNVSMQSAAINAMVFWVLKFVLMTSINSALYSHHDYKSEDVDENFINILAIY